ncbi:MAG: 4Fe-4S dicluster domain-containing protein [Pseudomonadota bacterium]
MRDIIEIHEDRCNGCGLCVLDCAEGAIEIINGKAKLVTDSFCDGLGACLSACPQDALRIIKREAVPFDEEAAMEHVRKRDAGLTKTGQHEENHKGCMGTQVHAAQIHVSKEMSEGKKIGYNAACEIPTSSGQWPLKIRLVPANAPFLQGAHVLVAADCAAFACPSFHGQYGKGKVILIGCPKFDDVNAYVERLADVLKHGNIASLTVARMEVPCCSGLANAVHKAYAMADVKQDAVPLTIITLDRLGQKVENAGGLGLTMKTPF